MSISITAALFVFVFIIRFLEAASCFMYGTRPYKIPLKHQLQKATCAVICVGNWRNSG